MNNNNIDLKVLILIFTFVITIVTSTKSSENSPTSIYTCRGGIDAVAIELSNGYRFYNSAKTVDPDGGLLVCPEELINTCIDILTILPNNDSFNCTSGSNTFCCAAIQPLQDCIDFQYNTKVNIYCKN